MEEFAKQCGLERLVEKFREQEIKDPDDFVDIEEEVSRGFLRVF